MDDYHDQYSDDVMPREDKKALKAQLVADFLSLESKIWEAQRKIGGDGSFGFQNARHRLFEARMWINREFND